MACTKLKHGFFEHTNHNDMNSLDSNRTSRQHLIINKGTYFSYSNHRVSTFVFQPQNLSNVILLLLLLLLLGNQFDDELLKKKLRPDCSINIYINQKF